MKQIDVSKMSVVEVHLRTHDESLLPVRSARYAEQRKLARESSYKHNSGRLVHMPSFSYPSVQADELGADLVRDGFRLEDVCVFDVIDSQRHRHYVHARFVRGGRHRYQCGELSKLFQAVASVFEVVVKEDVLDLRFWGLSAEAKSRVGYRFRVQANRLQEYEMSSV